MMKFASPCARMQYRRRKSWRLILIEMWLHELMKQACRAGRVVFNMAAVSRVLSIIIMCVSGLCYA